MSIAIYAGEGTLPMPLPGKCLTAKEIRETSWENSCSVFIMPGGRDLPYHLALQGPANARIRAFVENGGTYLGICAGAYYGAAELEFDRGFPLEVCGKRELAFFKGKAVGPAYGLGTFDYASNKGARAAKLTTSEDTFHAYYNGGCTFQGDLAKCQILARFADLPGKPPAIIQCKVGKGTAILSGAHIEVSWDTLDAKDPFLASLIPLLKTSEPTRKSFWDRLISPHLSKRAAPDEMKMEMKNRLSRIGSIVGQ